MYKRRTQPASNPTTVPTSHDPVLDTQSGENSILSSENILFDDIHSDGD